MNFTFSSPSTREFLYRLLIHLSKVNDFIVLYPTQSSLLIYSTSSCSCLFTVYSLNPRILEKYLLSSIAGYKIHARALLNLIKPKEFITMEFSISNDRFNVKSFSKDLSTCSSLLYEKVIPSLATYSKSLDFVDLTRMFGYFKDQDVILETLEDEIKCWTLSENNLKLKTQITLKENIRRDPMKIIISTKNLKLGYSKFDFESTSSFYISRPLALVSRVEYVGMGSMESVMSACEYLDSCPAIPKSPTLAPSKRIF